MMIQKKKFRTEGSHLIHRADGTVCCHCGPANVYTGPQWACDCREVTE